MNTLSVVMHIDIVPNRNSKPAILLRESYREGKKVKKRTIANISFLTIEQAEAFRLILKGEKVAPVDKLFEKLSSKHHSPPRLLSVSDPPCIVVQLRRGIKLDPVDPS